MDTPITMDAQIACVARELARRHRTYPGQVRCGPMTQPWADYQIACMTAVLRTLRALGSDPIAQAVLCAALEQEE